MNAKKNKLLLLAALLMLSPLGAGAVVLNGTLATDDRLGTDTVGPFYYDAYQFSVDSDAAVTIALTSADFDPWVAVWGTPVLPAALWEDGVSIDLYTSAIDSASAFLPGPASIVFNALAGVTYHVAAATLHYNPTPLGDYELSITSSASVQAGPIGNAAALPAPGVLALLGAALLLIRRRRDDVARIQHG